MEDEAGRLESACSEIVGRARCRALARAPLYDWCMVRAFGQHCTAAVCFLVCAGVGVSGCAGRERQSGMVYVVRHAEKADGSRDTALSPEGNARAAALANELDGREIDAILVTEYRRTLQTAMPLAGARRIEPRVVAVGGGDVQAHADRVASALREAGPDACVLVVGHSNTVPVILATLGVSESIAIDEEEFGRLYVVRNADIWGDGEGTRGAARGRVELVVRRFGD